jgi:hypothetical protein
MMKSLTFEERWLVGAGLLIGSILLAITMAYADPYSEILGSVYGDVYGDVAGDTYLSNPPSYQAPLIPPRPGATSPSVQFGQDGLTYTWPGQNGGPAVVVPTVPRGQSYIYFGEKGGPDVIVTPDGHVTFAWPGR